MPLTHLYRATPIVTPLKKDGVTPRICGDYYYLWCMAVNKVLKNYISTTEETEDLLNRLEPSKVFSVKRILTIPIRRGVKAADYNIHTI